MQQELISRTSALSDDDAHSVLGESCGELGISLDKALERTLVSPGDGILGTTTGPFARVGKFHLFVIFVCGLGWLADNAWLQIVSICKPEVRRIFVINDGVLISLQPLAIMLGGVLGGSVWGSLSDKFGRAKVFNFTLLAAGISGLLAALSPNYFVYIAAMFLVGFNIGGNLPIDAAYFCELTPSCIRGPLLVHLSIFWSIGGFFVALVAWAAIPNSREYGFRIVVACMSLYCFICLLTRRSMPESPAFYIDRGKEDRALQVLREVAFRNRAEHTNFDAIALEKPSLDSRQSSVADLFKGSARKTTILLWTIYFFLNLGFTSFNMFLPELLIGKGIASSTGIELYKEILIFQPQRFLEFTAAPA